MDSLATAHRALSSRESLPIRDRGAHDLPVPFGFMRAIVIPLLSVLILFGCGSSDLPAPQRTLELPHSLERAYVEAWRAGDQEGVMSLFDDDAVIIPSGSTPREGIDALESFWFPEDGSTTVIDAYETTIDGYRVHGDLAWWWGRGMLSFTWTSAEGEVFSVEDRKSTYTAIARLDPDGRWRFVHRAWADSR